MRTMMKPKEWLGNETFIIFGLAGWEDGRGITMDVKTKINNMFILLVPVNEWYSFFFKYIMYDLPRYFLF